MDEVVRFESYRNWISFGGLQFDYSRSNDLRDGRVTELPYIDETHFWMRVDMDFEGKSWPSTMPCALELGVMRESSAVS